MGSIGVLGSAVVAEVCKGGLQECVRGYIVHKCLWGGGQWWQWCVKEYRGMQGVRCMNDRCL